MIDEELREQARIYFWNVHQVELGEDNLLRDGKNVIGRLEDFARNPKTQELEIRCKSYRGIDYLPVEINVKI